MNVKVTVIFLSDRFSCLRRWTDFDDFCYIDRFDQAAEYRIPYFLYKYGKGTKAAL